MIVVRAIVTHRNRMSGNSIRAYSRRDRRHDVS